MDCRVVVEAAVRVYDVETPDEAVRVAIAKTGDLLNPDFSYVEITATPRACPHCGGEHDPAVVAADDALVALDLEIEVFNVETERHAERIALSELGQQLVDIPLAVDEVAVLTADEEGDGAADADQDAAGEGAPPDVENLFE